MISYSFVKYNNYDFVSKIYFVFFVKSFVLYCFF